MVERYENQLIAMAKEHENKIQQLKDEHRKQIA